MILPGPSDVGFLPVNFALLLPIGCLSLVASAKPAYPLAVNNGLSVLREKNFGVTQLCLLLSLMMRLMPLLPVMDPYMYQNVTVNYS